MNLKIINQTKEDLLSRKVIKAEIYFEGTKTPSNEEVKKAVAKELKADESLVVVKKINTHFGITEADITAYVYDSKEDMAKTEPKAKKAVPAAEAQAAPAAQA